MDISVAVALFAGLISFLSPCVLPLVPPYLCYLTGTSLEELSGEKEISSRLMGRVFLASLLFVLGFSTVFVALGATASVIGQMLLQNLPLLAQIAGAAIILMGLHFLGVFKFAFLNREVRYHGSGRPAGLGGAYVIGLAFAFGWTPCIGPVLAAILAVAATSDTVGTGAFLLAVYSAGLGIPFLLAALGMRFFLRFMQRFRQHLVTVERTMGGLLVLTGVMFLTGTMADISFWLIETFPVLATLG